MVAEEGRKVRTGYGVTYVEGKQKYSLSVLLAILTMYLIGTQALVQIMSIQNKMTYRIGDNAYCIDSNVTNMEVK